MRLPLFPRDDTNPPFEITHPPKANAQEGTTNPPFELTHPPKAQDGTNPPFELTHPPQAKAQDGNNPPFEITHPPKAQDDSNPPFSVTHPPPARDQRHELVQTQENPPFQASHPPTARDQRHELVGGSSEPSGMAPGAIAAIVIVVVLVVGAISWVVYTCLRARRLGLPTPTWRTFIPNRRTQSNSTSFEPTRPAAGGFMSRIFPSRNAGYDGRAARMERLREDQQVWNSDMRDDLEYRGAAGVQEQRRMEENGTSGPYSAGGDTERYDAQEDRGRSRSRDPPGRPQAGGVQGVKKEGDRPRESFESRRSVFTEEI